MEDGERRQMLRQLLVGWPIAFPAMAYGMLGGDPNGITVYELAWISEDLHSLGYRRRLRSHYLSGYTAAEWRREEEWPEDARGRIPYRGVPLKKDPDLADNRAAMTKRKRDFLRRLGTMR
jgi:hypothetical protein